MAFCPTCKRPFDDSAEFCPFDGSALKTGDGGFGGPTADHKQSASEEAVDQGDSKVVAVSAMESSVDALEATKRRRSLLYRGLIGKTLDGRYRIESVLGEGGMGIVFLAKHVVIEKVVAVKVLKKDAAKNESIAKRFVREAQAASRIAHPNIIDVTDFGTTSNGITYTVMEYVEGSTLAQVVRYEAPLPPERVLRIAAQMTRALKAAHDKGVVHRDLKPENVFLVDRDGRRDFVKIVDFGIARVLPIPGNSEVSRLTRVGTVFGTPEYMAPEQAAGRSDTDHRVDIYALGTIMYEMLCGNVPHRGDSTVRTLAMQMLDPVPPLSNIPTTANIDKEVEAVVMKALEKKREDRWQDMGVMLRAITQLTDEADTLRVSGSHALPPSGTTMLDGAHTEVEASPAGAQVTQSNETTELPGRGVTAAPTQVYQVLTPKGEPAFVRRPRRPSIDDLGFDNEPEEAPKSGKAWLVGLAFAVAAVAVVGLVVFARPSSGQKTTAEPSETNGAKVAVATASDAGPAETATNAVELDAGSEEPSGNPSTRPTKQTGSSSTKNPSKSSDAGGDVGGGGITSFGRDFNVEVITRPAGGSLWSGKDYAGSSGVVISRPYGTKLRLRCSKTGYRNGHVTVRFEGDKDLAVCWMKKRAKCVKDLKNPYAKCP